MVMYSEFPIAHETRSASPKSRLAAGEKGEEAEVDRGGQ